LCLMEEMIISCFKRPSQEMIFSNRTSNFHNCFFQIFLLAETNPHWRRRDASISRLKIGKTHHSAGCLTFVLMENMIVASNALLEGWYFPMNVTRSRLCRAIYIGLIRMHWFLMTETVIRKPRCGRTSRHQEKQKPKSSAGNFLSATYSACHNYIALW
jgi:hypothetical protein